MKSSFPLKRFIVGVLLIILCVVISICKIQPLFPDGWVELLAALFGGLAFVAMFCALIMQSQELSLQRQELSETREVLKETSLANQESAETARRNLRAQYLFIQIEQKDKYEKILEKCTELSHELAILEERNTLCNDCYAQKQGSKKSLEKHLRETMNFDPYEEDDKVHEFIMTLAEHDFYYMEKQIEKLKKQKEFYEKILADYEKYFNELDELTTSEEANNHA